MTRSAAKAFGVPFNEETITETILLNLVTAYPSRVRVIAFNKSQEAKTGADWAWSFVSAKASWSMTMLVQAKRLDDAEQTYSGINRNIGKRNSPVRQIDQLLATAQVHSVPALYFFYNHISQISRVPQRCCSLAIFNKNRIEGFGISIADAYAVHAVLPDETFDKHCSHSMPLHCLLCSKGSGTRSALGTPLIAASGIAKLRTLSLRDALDPDTLGLRQGLHPLIEFAIRVASRPAGGADHPEGDEVPGIAGVVIFEDAEE